MVAVRFGWLMKLRMSLKSMVLVSRAGDEENVGKPIGFRNCVMIGR